MLIRFSIVILLITQIVSCSSTSNDIDVSTDDRAIAFVNAADQLISLVKQGRVPGLDGDDHGLIRSPRLELRDSPVEYPLEMSIQLQKAKSDDAIYWFVLRKETKDREWELVEGWNTDSQGRYRRHLIERKQ
jgi:hypothetical protein